MPKTIEKIEHAALAERVVFRGHSIAFGIRAFLSTLHHNGKDVEEEK